MLKIVKKYFQMLIKLFQDKKQSNFIIRMLVISTVLFIFFSIIHNLNKDKKYIDKYSKMSVFNEGSSGTSALKEFFQSFNFKINKIYKPLIQLKNIQKNKYSLTGIPSGVILIIEPETCFQEVDIDIIKMKAKQGFTIVIFSDKEYKIREFIKKKKKKSKKALWIVNTNYYYKTVCKKNTYVRYDRYGVLWDGKKISLPGKKRIRKWGKGWRILLKDKFGVFSLIKKIGKGRIILFSDSKFISNYHLSERDNGVFIYRFIKHFLKNRILYFNEYYHGYQRRYTMFYFFARKDFFNIVLQFLIFFFFLFITSSVKFGQYSKSLKIEDEKIYYYSEGIANLMNNRKYNNDILNLMIRNLKRAGNLKPGIITRMKLNKIKLLLKLKKNKVNRSIIKAVFKIIKNKTKE